MTPDMCLPNNGNTTMPWQTYPTTTTIYQPQEKKMNEADVRDLRRQAMQFAIDSLSKTDHPDDDEHLKKRAKMIFKFLVKTF